MNERGRSRPPAPPPEDDPSIPVLTERLTLPALEVDFTLPPLPPATPGPDDLPRRPVAESPPAIDALHSSPLPATTLQPLTQPPAAPVVAATAPSTLPGAPMIPASIARVPLAPAVEPPRILGGHAEPFDPEPPDSAPVPMPMPMPVQVQVPAPERPDPRAELLRAVMQRMPSDVEQLVGERFGGALQAGVQTALQQAAAGLAAQLAVPLASQLATRLAAQLAEQIAPQLAAQLSAELAAPLAAQVTAQLAAQISTEARSALAGSVHALIDQALAAELDRLRAAGQ